MGLLQVKLLSLLAELLLLLLEPQTLDYLTMMTPAWGLLFPLLLLFLLQKNLLQQQEILLHLSLLSPSLLELATEAQPRRLLLLLLSRRHP